MKWTQAMVVEEIENFVKGTFGENASVADIRVKPALSSSIARIDMGYTVEAAFTIYHPKQGRLKVKARASPVWYNPPQLTTLTEKELDKFLSGCDRFDPVIAWIQHVFNLSESDLK